MSREACIELAQRLGRDPVELVEWWAERAAIRQHEGAQSRAAAEAAAFDDLYDTLIRRRGPATAGAADSVGEAMRRDRK